MGKLSLWMLCFCAALAIATSAYAKGGTYHHPEPYVVHPDAHRWRARGEDAKYLMSVARQKVHHLVNLIYRPTSPEDASKENEFSRKSVEERWLAGYRDTVHALRHPEVLEPASGCDAGVFVFDFEKDGG